MNIVGKNSPLYPAVNALEQFHFLFAPGLQRIRESYGNLLFMFDVFDEMENVRNTNI